MTNTDWRLFCAAILAIAGAASAWTEAPVWVRVILGLPLALYLPGYAWLSAATPKRPEGAERITLSVGLSLALCVLIGMALNAIGRLDRIGWAEALSGFTVLCCFIAACRRMAPSHAALRISTPHAAAFALALLIAGFGVRYAADALEAHREFKFTQLWMTPRSNDDHSLVTIGVRNEEGRSVTYAVTVMAEDAEVGRWPSFELKPGESWTTEFAINGALRKRRVEAWLRRADAPAEVYRKVWIAPVVAISQR